MSRSKLNKTDIPYYNFATSLLDVDIQASNYIIENNIVATSFSDTMVMGTLFIGQTNTGPVIRSMSSQPLTLDSDVVISGRLGVLAPDNIVNIFNSNCNIESNVVSVNKGNALNPTITFSDNTNTGFYNASNVTQDSIAITLGGLNYLNFQKNITSNIIYPDTTNSVSLGNSTNRFNNIYCKNLFSDNINGNTYTPSSSNITSLASGNATNPSLYFTTSNSTGIYQHSTGLLSVSSGGTPTVYFGGNHIGPVNTGVYDLGSNNNRFQKLWCTQAINQSSDIRLKYDIQDLKKSINDPIKFISDLNVVSYKFKPNETPINSEQLLINPDATPIYNSNVKDTYGLIVQQVQDVVNNNNVKNFNAIEGSNETSFGLDYNQIHIINILAVQDLIKENKEMKTKISSLENKVSLLTKYIEKL